MLPAALPSAGFCASSSSLMLLPCSAVVREVVIERPRRACCPPERGITLMIGTDRLRPPPRPPDATTEHFLCVRDVGQEDARARAVGAAPAGREAVHLQPAFGAAPAVVSGEVHHDGPGAGERRRCPCGPVATTICGHQVRPQLNQSRAIGELRQRVAAEDRLLRRRC